MQYEDIQIGKECNLDIEKGDIKMEQLWETAKYLYGAEHLYADGRTPGKLYYNDIIEALLAELLLVLKYNCTVSIRQSLCSEQYLPARLSGFLKLQARRLIG